MNTNTGEVLSWEEMERRRQAGELTGHEKLLTAAREVEQAERMLAQGKAFVSKRDTRSPLGRKFTLSRKRQRYLDRKRRERDGNRKAGNTRKTPTGSVN